MLSVVQFGRVLFVFAIAFAACSVNRVSCVSTTQDQVVGYGNIGTVLWSVLDGCYNSDSAGPPVICLKSKALTALDRALTKPTVILTDSVALAARDQKSLASPLTEKTDWAALESARDLDHKGALLDDMLLNRINEFVSTRTVVLDSFAPEGRGNQKEQKGMSRALIMVGMAAVAILVPMVLSFVSLLAIKAILIGKMALIISGFTAFKNYQKTTESMPQTHYDRRIEYMANNRAYSGQYKQ